MTGKLTGYNRLPKSAKHIGGGASCYIEDILQSTLSCLVKKSLGPYLGWIM